MSFKQYWKAKENLLRIPARAGSKILSSLSQCTGSGPEVREWCGAKLRVARGPDQHWP